MQNTFHRFLSVLPTRSIEQPREQTRQQVPDMLCFVEGRPGDGKPDAYINVTVDCACNVGVWLSIPAQYRSSIVPSTT